MSEIVRRVQADGAISGSVNWTGNRAHVFVQLVRAGSSTPVWVKQFDVPARRAAELPRSVARDVAGALGLKLSAADELALSGQDSSAPEAFEAYLRARVLMRAATVPAVKQAIEQLQEALRLDPSHGPSLAALARCYILQSVSQGTRPLAEAGPLAREAAERALQLDSQLPEAHQALAEVKFYVDWDWAGADDEFKRAVEFRPNSGDLRSRYAMFLASRKRLPDAMQEVHQAVALDPMSPLANASLGMLWHYARSDDQAERIYRGVLEADPSFMPARLGLIRTYLQTRRFDVALRELERNRSDARGELSTGQQSLMALAYIGLGRTCGSREDRGEPGRSGRRSAVGRRGQRVPRAEPTRSCARDHRARGGSQVTQGVVPPARSALRCLAQRAPLPGAVAAHGIPFLIACSHRSTIPPLTITRRSTNTRTITTKERETECPGRCR